jgi:hypothetical protein
MSGGGGGGGVTSFLPMAAALAATVMTDGAAAPWLEESLAGTALEGAGSTIAGAGIGALAGGATGALTGQNVGRSALMGGITGGAAGYGGLYSGAPEAGVGGTATPLTGSNVSGNAAVISSNAAAGTGTGSVLNADQLKILDQTALNEDMALGPNAQTYTPGTTYTPAPQTPPGTGPGFGTTPYTPVGTQTGLGATLTKYAPYALGATALGAVMQSDKSKYGVPSTASQQYNGPLTKLHYDPSKYTPITTAQPTPPYTPVYPNYVAMPYTAAEGGMVPSYASGGLMDPNSEPLDFASGGMYPQSQQHTSAYATPTQMPATAQATASLYEPKTNPLTGEEMANMAAGGIAGTPSLGSYAAGGNPRLLKGPGDGMSDNIPATIGAKQPARLADGEFVVPADVVSHLGNGSTDAGAKRLYNMMDKVRKARTGSKKQGKEIKADKYLPA